MNRAMIAGLAVTVAAGFAGSVRAEEGDGDRAKRQDMMAKMMERRFSHMDKDGDGALSKEEFPKPERFDALDADKDGKVTLDEMRNGIREHLKGRVEGAVRGAVGARLKKLDTDGDGKVSKSEFDAAFAKLDKDGDGYVTEEEFKAAGGDRPERKKTVKTE